MRHAPKRFVLDTGSSGFGNDLRYLYNGNIAAMTTSLKEPGNNDSLYVQGMQYRYDQLNRLTEATAYKKFNREDNEWIAEVQDTGYTKMATLHQ